ncbi:DUF6232 family protein [Streptomyces sp. NPDC012637]|uniref:DUF6232 family protein n=1 Tax=Streptomyces sp. NPDC012637 TaxID=3364842 RepID=UPI0036F127FF
MTTPDRPSAAPPPPPPSAPPSPPTATPTVFNGVDVVISKRLLWVGGAVYPLHNIARVYTFMLHPRRGEAVRRFLKRTALTLIVAMAFTFFTGIASFGSQSDLSGLLTFIWLGAIGALIWFLIDMIMVLSAKSHFVLAVESNGQSTALVTAPSPGTLHQLVQSIAHAIEHPDTELQVRVERLMIGSPNNYYFGDTVNMYGGQGNVGMAA